MEGSYGPDSWAHLRRTPLALVMAFSAIGCGDNHRYGYGGYGGYYGGGGPDAGLCSHAGGSGRSCVCVDRPYLVAASMAIDATGALSDLDLALVRADEIAPTSSVTPPAQGTPGASNDWVATLMGGDGSALSSLVFAGTAGSDGGYSRHHAWGAGRVRIVLPLLAGATDLRIESWDTGQLLVDLDLRGHLQLLCIDHPCLSLCPSRPSGGVDAGSAQPDGGAVAPVDAAVTPSDGAVAPVDAIVAPVDAAPIDGELEAGSGPPDE